MMSRLVKIGTVLGIVFVVLVGQSQPAFAKKKKDFTVSPKVYKKISKTHELIQAENYAGALEAAKAGGLSAAARLAIVARQLLVPHFVLPNDLTASRPFIVKLS